MNTDTFLQIGSTHPMCEDYVLTGENFAIISDGCSGSKNTDVGARILCYSAASIIKQAHSIIETFSLPQLRNYLSLNILHRALVSCFSIGIDAQCLDATLIIAIKLKDIVATLMYGDGYVIGLRNNGEIHITTTTFHAKNGNEMPFYLNYSNSNTRLASYKNEQIKTEVLKTNINPFNATSITTPTVVPFDHPFYETFGLNQYKAIFIGSDGLSSFYELPNRRILDDSIIIEQLVQIKNWHGPFLQRRLNKLLKIHKLHDPEIRHYDDLSVAAIHLG